MTVRTLRDSHTLGYAPGERLLMQGYHADILVQEAEGFRNHGVAGSRIALDQDLGRQPIDLGIAVAAEVEGAALAVCIAADDQVRQHVPAVEGVGRPPEEVK